MLWKIHLLDYMASTLTLDLDEDSQSNVSTVGAYHSEEVLMECIND